MKFEHFRIRSFESKGVRIISKDGLIQVKIKKISKIPLLLFIVFLFTGFILYVIIFFGPKSDIGVLSRELSDKQKQFEEIKNLSIRKTALINQFNKLTLKVQEIDARIPAQNYTTNFISSLYTWGKKNKVEIINIFPDYTEKRNEYEINRILIEAKGSLENIKAMTRFISNGNKNIGINMLTLQVDIDGTYFCRISVELYRLKS